MSAPARSSLVQCFTNARDSKERPSKARLIFNSFYCLWLLIVGQTVYSFSLYSQALRFQLDFTALNNQYVYNFGLLGFSFSTLFTGWTLEKGGPRLALMLGAIFSTFGAALASLATQKSFDCPAQLFWFLSFMAGVGQGFPYITGITVNTRNFSLKSRGRIVALTLAVSSLSAMFYSVIYRSFYVTNPDLYDETSQDLAGFWWFMTAFMGVVNFIGALHVRVWEVYPEEEEAPEAVDGGTVANGKSVGSDDFEQQKQTRAVLTNVVTQNNEDESVNEKLVEPASKNRQLQRVVSESYEPAAVPDSPKKLSDSSSDSDDNEARRKLLDKNTENSSSDGSSGVSGDGEPKQLKGKWGALWNSSYIALLWVYIVHKGVDKTYIGDIGKIGQSLGFDSIVSTHVLVHGFASAFSRLSSGFVFDFFRGKIKEWQYLMFAMGLLCAMDVLLILFMIPMYEYYLSTIGHGLASLLYAILPTVVANRFGRENMANGWALMVALSAAGTFAYGGWNSALYDANNNTGTDICKGPQCFRDAFIIAACTLLTAMAVLLWKGRDDQFDSKEKLPGDAEEDEENSVSVTQGKRV